MVCRLRFTLGQPFAEETIQMRITRRQALTTLAVAMTASCQMTANKDLSTTRYVRFSRKNRTAYGILERNSINEIVGDPFGLIERLEIEHRLEDVKLLYPCTPTKILALAGNYKSHLSDQHPPSRPQVFYKPVSALQNPNDPIIIPKGATEVHYEGELVIVLKRRAHRVSVAEAKEVILGVTCGNDVSERQWQGGSEKDVQWWRAKGADTFAPLGPCIAQGIDYGNLLMTTRLNGQVVQEVSTSKLIFDCPTVVSFISRYVTLMPGDLIYTGTSGKTGPMNAGDRIEVEVEGVGTLINPVVKAKG